MSNYHSKSKEEIFHELKTSEKGLSQKQAQERLKKYGKNVIKKTHRLRPLKIPQKTILSERRNMLFTGTQIVRGSAKAIIVSTGINTVFGKIAENLQEIEVQKTPMQKRLDKFSKQIGIFILAFVGLVIFLGITEHFDIINMFMVAVALAVSAIPEG
ncbi:unnamed protein product, partial [marine sediment metagenome]